MCDGKLTESVRKSEHSVSLSALWQPLSPEARGLFAALVLVLGVACLVHLHQLVHHGLVPRRDLPIDGVGCGVHVLLRDVEAGRGVQRLASHADFFVLHAPRGRPLTHCVVLDAEITDESPWLNLTVDVLLLQELVVHGDSHLGAGPLTQNVVVVLASLLDHFWVLIDVVVFVVEYFWAGRDRCRPSDLAQLH